MGVPTSLRALAVQMSGESILIIDDDVELATLMAKFLNANGLDAHVIHHGDEAEGAIFSLQPDLVVLDLMLPGTDGLSICRSVRARYHGPIIMLTALNDEIDEVTGLEVGADDYLAKPVKPRVLLAHMRAQLRRYGRLDASGKDTQGILSGGELFIDAGRREVRKNDALIALTSAEFDLLWMLAEHQGTVVSRETLYQQIYRLEFDGLDRSIDLRVSKLRKKTGVDKSGSPFIKTVRGVGYQLSR